MQTEVGNSVVGDAFDAHCRLVHLFEVTAATVGGSNRRNIGDEDIFRAVGEAGYGLTTIVRRIVEDVAPRTVGSRNAHTSAIGIEFEGGMQSMCALGLVAPDDGVAMGGDYCRNISTGSCYLIFLRVVFVVA